MKHLRLIIPIICVLIGITAVSAQENQLSLRLNRDFGSGFGTQIRGAFSLRVEGPDNLVRVEFFIDNTLIGETSEAPFRFQIRTSNYEDGTHIMSATGYTNDGQILQSNQIQRQFISTQQSTNKTLLIVIPILVLSFGGTILSSWIANRNRRQAGKPTVNGPLGGTICKNCGQPFAIHWWSLRLVTVRADRCPHCGKWSLVQRAHPDVLNAALDEKKTAVSPTSLPSADDNLKRNLDDSRFTD